MGFDHAKHEDVECASCHSASITNDGWQPRPLVPQAKCEDCHGEKKVEVAEASCKSCHGADVKAMAPPDHQVTWGKRHGDAAKWRVWETHGTDCTTCHQNDSCTTCHSTKKPDSHTALWRMRGHGQAASWDQASCNTCHETGQCIQCHKTTPPQNHSGNWMSAHGFAAQVRSADTCTTCHSVSECYTCHTGAGK
jgi:hypothetical protein